jgi:hypothetical protein
MDVEAILKEIRNRVVADDLRGSEPAALEGSNGSPTPSNQRESLTRVSSHLAVTGRAWDRLPPLISNRRGMLARLELWLKKKSKPLTRWFTWEQVNFNRAVNDALCDVIEILKSEANEPASLRAHLTGEIQRQSTALRSEAAGYQADIDARLIRVNQTISDLANHNRESKAQQVQLLNEHTKLQTAHAQLQTAHAQLQTAHTQLQTAHANLDAEHSKLAEQVIELAAQLRREDEEIKSQHDQEINRRLDELAAELKNEQRVCFRQISLETSEAAVLEDRARRALISRLEELEESLKALQRR